MILSNIVKYCARGGGRMKNYRNKRFRSFTNTSSSLNQITNLALRGMEVREQNKILSNSYGSYHQWNNDININIYDFSNSKNIIVQKKNPYLLRRYYSSDSNNDNNPALFPSEAEYDIKAEYFLEDLSSKLDELDDFFDDLDTDYAQGVLTMHLGDGHGTYVLNKQRPNQQIWFSSPTSGPKRFEFNFDTSRWVSTRNGEDLLELLNSELLDINKDIDIDLESL